MQDHAQASPPNPKPPRVRRVVHRDKDFKDSDVESEDDDDDDEHICCGEGKTALDNTSSRAGELRWVISGSTGCVPDFSVVLLAVI